MKIPSFCGIRYFGPSLAGIMIPRVSLFGFRRRRCHRKCERVAENGSGVERKLTAEEFRILRKQGDGAGLHFGYVLGLS